jgi:hypothetical protein
MPIYKCARRGNILLSDDFKLVACSWLTEAKQVTFEGKFLQILYEGSSKPATYYMMLVSCFIWELSIIV